MCSRVCGLVLNSYLLGAGDEAVHLLRSGGLHPDPEVAAGLPEPEAAPALAAVPLGGGEADAEAEEGLAAEGGGQHYRQHALPPDPLIQLLTLPGSLHRQV